MRTIVILILMLVSIMGCTKKTDVFVFDCVVYDDKVDVPVSGASIIMKVQNAAGGLIQAM